MVGSEGSSTGHSGIFAAAVGGAGTRGKCPYLLVGEVPQLLVAQRQDAGALPGDLRVDVVVVGRALGELQDAGVSLAAGPGASFAHHPLRP